MKVRCIKTSLNNSDNTIINSDMDEYLILDTLFWVFGITFFKNVTYVYIFNGDHLFEVPIGLFEVVEDDVSNEWKIKVWENGEITLWPELFYQESFFENFAERENYERNIFQNLSNKIERSNF